MPKHDFPTPDDKPENTSFTGRPEEALLCIGAGFALVAGLVGGAAMLTPAEVVDKMGCRVGQIMDEMTSYNGSPEDVGVQPPRRDCN